MMKSVIPKECNDDALIVTSNDGEEFNSQGNKLKMIVQLS